MEPLLAVMTGGVFATGLYLILRRSIVKLLIGLVLLSNAANLVIFTTAGLQRGKPPLIPEGATAPLQVVADPLPQALVLTAIVISFGVLAFAMVLVHRTHQMVDTDDLNDLTSTDS